MIRVSWCRWSLLAVLILQPIWFGLMHPSAHFPLPLVLGVTMLPLLAPLYGVWRLGARALVIAGIVLMFHFSYAVMEAYANPLVRPIALIQIALVIIYFTGLAMIRRKPKSAD
ncbi:MAG: DUF2069 domain-containing protein [Wenzhouxiangella sp.]|nr:MAG: DUF2069 domain-containing protein [Wenzhouxiangella sp.]